MAHRVAHGLPGGRRADPLPPRLPAHRRSQPDPRECPRTGRQVLPSSSVGEESLTARGESRSYEGSTQSIHRTTLTRMAMGTRETDQPPLWIATSDLPTSPGHPFYARLTTLLDGHHFDRFVEGLCDRFYAPRDGPTELGTRALLPPAAGRLLRRHRLGTRDCVARAGLVGGPQLSAVGRGRGATRSFDDCAHAALDRSGDAPDRLYVGATTTRRGRPSDGQDHRD